MTSRFPRSVRVTAVALVAASGLTLGGCGSDPASSSGPDGSSPLFGTVWSLTTAAEDGAPVEVPTQPALRWQFIEDNGCEEADPECPDGSKVVGNDACNSFTRSIDVDGDIVVWGAYWHSTLVACSGGLADTMQELFHYESFQYAVTGDQLHLTSATGIVELTYRPSDDMSINGDVIDSPPAATPVSAPVATLEPVDEAITIASVPTTPQTEGDG